MLVGLLVEMVFLGDESAHAAGHGGRNCRVLEDSEVCVLVFTSWFDVSECYRCVFESGALGVKL